MMTGDERAKYEAGLVKRDVPFRERSREDLDYVESVFPNCMAMTFRSEEEWLMKRRSFLCASDTPSILGIGFRSNVAVWEDKCDPDAVKRRRPPSADAERRMRMGRLSEPHVRDQFGIDTNLPVFDGTNILVVNTSMLDSRGEPFMAATLDGFAALPNGDVMLLEIKRTESWSAFGANIPLGYRAQVLKQMIVTGAKSAVLAARCVRFNNVPDSPLNLRNVQETDYCITLDEQAKYDMECIVKAERQFWENHVVARKKPDLFIPDPA